MDRLSLQYCKQLLSANSLFSELTQDDLFELVAIAKYETYAVDEVVLRQGEYGDEMFIIVKGKVLVRLHLADNEDITIGELSAGDAFGEIALFDRQPRTATIITSDTCEMLVLHRDVFTIFLFNHPSVAIQLLTVMANRLRKTNELLKDSMYSEITSRIADAILNIANAYGKNTRSGLQVDTVFDDHELGEIAGVPTDVIAAQLRQWRKEGVINVSHGHLTLLKPEALLRAQ